MLRFQQGRKCLPLLGASGCGKSMTLKCIAGIETPDEGKIVLNGRTLFDSEKKINLIPQKRKSWIYVSGLCAVPAPDSPQERGIRARQDEANLLRPPFPAARNPWRRFWNALRSGIWPSGIPVNSGPEAARRTARALSPRPGCCCWTNPLPRWIRSSGSGCAARSAPCSTNGTSPSC
mgnify:CR=1 FL=1